MEILGKILGNPARVKIMRLFLLNKNKGFNIGDVAGRSRVDRNVVRRELRLLASVGFIKRRSSSSPFLFFDPFFKYVVGFEELLIRSGSLSSETILEHFKKIGQVKLFVISGIFTKTDDSRLDILIVGNKMKKREIERGVRRLEAELGSELVYAVFDTAEFIYRLNMYDKLVRDVLDFPHEVLIQSKELSTQALKKA